MEPTGEPDSSMLESKTKSPSMPEVGTSIGKALLVPTIIVFIIAVFLGLGLWARKRGFKALRKRFFSKEEDPEAAKWLDQASQIVRGRHPTESMTIPCPPLFTGTRLIPAFVPSTLVLRGREGGDFSEIDLGVPSHQIRNLEGAR
ncbi:hypothetical protein LTR37_005161 [Vermiconidia calcicola]|uniref:Uncharacterized protein n=1 Tax=Vermiconidia calcicola TaxID=1690605 RepID=A0ACC3NLB8_9PEZI|nr:hypothetical protein LTR37_005161 [Vermiconidia calcicola]